MSRSQRIEGDQVYCHVCSHQWDRAHGGLQCPACESEFVEIVDSNRPPPIPPHPQSLRSPQSPRSPLSPDPFHNHNPWAPDPDEDDVTMFEFNTGGGGRATMSFSTRTYTVGGGNMRGSNDAADEIGRNLEVMLGNIMGMPQRRQPTMPGHFYEYPPSQNERGFGRPPQGDAPNFFSVLFQAINQPRHPQQGPSPLDLFGAMLNPGSAQRGDIAYSQEAFDRIMTQLMEQNSSNAPGPASSTAIAGLKKKPVDEAMMGSDGKAECSICMDSLELGDEVTVLPCNHWFHGDCVISWLREHDTCPHCRQPITPEASDQPMGSTRRRRASRRSSSIASPISTNLNASSRDGGFADSPSGLREARQRYYGSPRTHDFDTNRPSQDRRSSDRSQQSNDNNSGGGVGGWIRSRLPFSGQ